MTPRTDKQICVDVAGKPVKYLDAEVVEARFARELETELAAANRQLENLKIQSAIARTDAEIRRVEIVLAQMRSKQISRHRELARQEAIARCSNS